MILRLPASHDDIDSRLTDRQIDKIDRCVKNDDIMPCLQPTMTSHPSLINCFTAPKPTPCNGYIITWMLYQVSQLLNQHPAMDIYYYLDVVPEFHSS